MSVASPRPTPTALGHKTPYQFGLARPRKPFDRKPDQPADNRPQVTQTDEAEPIGRDVGTISGVRNKVANRQNLEQVRHPLEVRCAPGAELTREVLPADSKPPGQRGGGRWFADRAGQEVKGPPLERLGQPERHGDPDERLSSGRGSTAPGDEISNHRVVDALDHDPNADRGEIEEDPALVGPNDAVEDHRNAGEPAPKVGEVDRPAGPSA